MKKIFFPIFIFFLFIFKIKGQEYYHYKSETGNYIEQFIEAYGKNEYIKTLKLIQSYSTDSLISKLEYYSINIPISMSIYKMGVSSGYGGDIDAINYESLTGFLIYSELIRRNIDSSAVYYYGGILKREQNYYHYAIKDFTKALSFKKEELPYDDFIIMGIRGEMKFQIDDYYGAINDLSFAITLIKSRISQVTNLKKMSYEADLYAFILKRGKSYFMIKKFKDALIDFTEIIKDNPSCGECFFLRGITYLSMNQKENGCIDLSTAGSLGYEKAYEAINEFCK